MFGPHAGPIDFRQAVCALEAERYVDTHCAGLILDFQGVRTLVFGDHVLILGRAGAAFDTYTDELVRYFTAVREYRGESLIELLAEDEHRIRRHEAEVGEDLEMRYGIDRDRGAYVQTYVYMVQSKIHILLFIFVAEIIVVVAFVGVSEIVVRVVIVADEILVLGVVYLRSEVYGELQDIGNGLLVQVDVASA